VGFRSVRVRFRFCDRQRKDASRSASFKEATLISLDDPVVVRLPDGRFRMYVGSLRSDQVCVVVSDNVVKSTRQFADNAPADHVNHGLIIYRLIGRVAFRFECDDAAG
jgi:hypothetical protein